MKSREGVKLISLKKTTFFVFIWLCFNTLLAQVYNFKSYTVEDGLPQSQVFSSYQDANGYLWFGTNGGGIAKFDGKKFLTFDTEHGLADNRVLAISGWKNNTLLIGTMNGAFSIFDSDHFTNFNKADGLNADKVFSITTYKRNVYLGTDNGIFIFDSKDSSFQQFSIDEGLKGKVVRTLFKDTKNRIWVGTDKGVSLIYKSKLHDVEFLKDFPHQSVKVICEDKLGNIWIAFKKGGVIKFDGTVITQYTAENGLPDNNVSALASGEENTMWLGFDRDGLVKIDSSGTVQHITDQNGLCSNLIFSLSADYEGNIWIGTSGNGVCLYNNDAYSLYNTKVGLNSNIVLSTLKDKAGNYWFGTVEGLCINDGVALKSLGKKDGFYANRVTSIVQDNEDNIWFTTYENGILKYDGKNFKAVKNSRNLKGFPFISSFLDSKGGVWFGTFGYGVFRYFKGSFEHYSSSSSSVNDIVYCFYEDENAHIWLGTEQGLSVFDGEIFTDKTFDEKITFPVHNIISEQHGLWISGYGNGLYFVNQKKDDEIKIITTKDGLLDKDIIAMQKDAYGNLYLSTMKGLQKMPLNLYHDSSKIALTKVNYEDGFSGGECNPRAIYIDPADNLWFGTINGVVKYNQKNNIVTKRKYPRIFINDIKLDFTNVNWEEFDVTIDPETALPEDVSLEYDQNHLTFDYIGINFKNSQKISYQYKIKGIDEDWSPITKLTSVTYPSIQPGDYVFMVRAINGDNVWSQGSAEFKFSISSPFWKTPWFYALIVLLIISIAILISRRRTIALQKSKKMLEEQVLARTIEIVKQKEIIETKNKDITDSIRYAKRIQEAILPIASLLRKNLPKSFIYYKPKDIVSGDFYWYAKRKSKFVLAAVDCTGHGVPGALMSVIGNSILKDIVKQIGITDPSKVLTRLNDEVLITLKQRNSAFDDHDGMDICLVEFDISSKIMVFSGANRPLYIVRGKELIVIKGDGWPIGGFYKNKKTFNNHEVQLENGDMVYLSSDGYVDQFGGPLGKKFKTKKFKALLQEIAPLETKRQKEKLIKAHKEWAGSEDQVDDILIIGFKVE